MVGMDIFFHIGKGSCTKTITPVVMNWYMLTNELNEPLSNPRQSDSRDEETQIAYDCEKKTPINCD